MKIFKIFKMSAAVPEPVSDFHILGLQFGVPACKAVHCYEVYILCRILDLPPKTTLRRDPTV